MNFRGIQSVPMSSDVANLPLGGLRDKQTDLLTTTKNISLVSQRGTSL
jgi:hypothetical protein